VVKALSHLDDINFDISNTEADVVGYAHEYWIGESASGAGKKPGEFYTQQKISTLLAKMVTQGKERSLPVYDPTCSSGYLLLWAKCEGKDVDMIYGQVQG
jgi:type I restriction enzyme M protein